MFASLKFRQKHFEFDRVWIRLSRIEIIRTAKERTRLKKRSRIRFCAGEIDSRMQDLGFRFDVRSPSSHDSSASSFLDSARGSARDLKLARTERLSARNGKGGSPETMSHHARPGISKFCQLRHQLFRFFRSPSGAGTGFDSAASDSQP